MSFSLSKSARLRIKTQTVTISPTKHKKHTIYNNDKLKVFIKFKPQQNIQKNTCVINLNDKEIQIQTSINKKIYQFDHVFTPDVESKEIFGQGCEELIAEVIQGVKIDKVNNNGLVFVYGNTGTGKTYTMGLIDQLTSKSTGIVPQALRYIFSTKQTNTMSQICLSFCEIYRDQIYDLLSFQQCQQQKKLSIRQNQKNKQPYIQDLIMIQVNSLKQAYQLINIGLEKRRVAQQKVNKRSSRGHGVITVYMKGQKGENCGRMSFVDLAGCQRIKQSESKGATLNQALHINTSLSALQTLLMNISDQNVRSYRSNKLTRLLQPYFQFGKIRLFVTSNYESTQSIQFAKRCKGIRFLQREVKKQKEQKFDYKTPRKQTQKPNYTAHKKSQINQKKLQQKFQKLKKYYISRQNNLLKCISNMMSIIHKLYQSINSSLSSISIHSSFMLPQLFQHLPLQQKVNNKINIYQKKEEQIVQEDYFDDTEKLSQLSTNISRSFEDCQIEKKTQDLIKNMQEIGFLTIKKVNQLAELVQYKNVYKKQWFTSQIKNGLLQNKNKQVQKGLGYLIGEIGGIMIGSKNSKRQQNNTNQNNQHRIYKKLKDFGIVLSSQHENQQNIKNSINKRPSVLNKSVIAPQLSTLKSSMKAVSGRLNLSTNSNNNNTKSNRSFTQSCCMLYKDENVQSSVFEQVQQKSQYSSRLFDRQRKRSLIYIDQQ